MKNSKSNVHSEMKKLETHANSEAEDMETEMDDDDKPWLWYHYWMFVGFISCAIFTVIAGYQKNFLLLNIMGLFCMGLCVALNMSLVWYYGE